MELVYCVVHNYEGSEAIKSIHSSHKKARVYRNKYILNRYYYCTSGTKKDPSAYKFLINELKCTFIQIRMVDPE